MANIDRIESVPFAQIANSVLRDKRLSYKARGILSFVLSHSDGFRVTRDSLIDASDVDGKDAVQSGLNELTDLGYRVVDREQEGDGTWRTITYWYQHPVTRPTEGRETRPSENQAVIKNTNEEYKEDHLSLSSNVSTGELEKAADVVREVFGDSVIEEREDSSPDSTPQTSNTGEHNRHRAVALEKAQTEKPIKLWLAFDPENAGYERSDFKREFPLLDYDAILARFVDYYLDAKPRTNWMATYFAYVTEAQRRAAEAKAQGGVETDSMGLPLDPSKRRVGDTPEKLAERIESYRETRERFAALEEEE